MLKISQKFSENKRKIGGFSLIEMIIYVAIVAIIFVVVVNTIIIVSTAWGRARVQRTISFQGGSVMERMLREVRLADQVNIGASVFGSDPGAIARSPMVRCPAFR